MMKGHDKSELNQVTRALEAPTGPKQSPENRKALAVLPTL